MKVKLKLIKIERKGMAGLIALLGVALILCVVAFPTPNDISVGEMAYQKLWLGRMTVVFAVCCLPFLCLNKKQYLSFPSIVTWVLIILGGIEAIWGLGKYMVSLFLIIPYMHLQGLSIIRDLTRDIWQ